MSEYNDKYIQLGKRFSKIEKITKLNQGEDKEAWTLSHSLLDIEESCKIFIEQQLPNLLKENISDKQVSDILFDISENLRHILYHIKDPKYFSYIFEEKNDKE